MKVFLGLFILCVVSCTKAPESKFVAAGSIQHWDCVIELKNLGLKPIALHESPLQRWQRAKANFDTALKTEESLSNDVRNCTTGRVIGEYLDAEKALQNAGCTKVCAPPK